MQKTHIKDIRLASNAGIGFPVCQVADVLDLDKTRWRMAARAEDATCERCQRAYAKQYPWAVAKRG